MDEKSQTCLETALSETLERFAFMFQDTEGASAGHGHTPGEACRAAMNYTGSQTVGVVKVAASQALCSLMAANVLGKEAGDVSKEEAEDSLKEFLNITCGRLTDLLYGQKAVTQLSVPVLDRLDAGTWAKAQAEPGALSLVVEGFPLLANLVVKTARSREG